MFFHWSKFKARSHDNLFSWTFDLLFITSGTDIYYVEFISHYIKEILYLKTPKKTNHEIKAKRYTFSLASSDTDVEKSYFLCRVKIPYQQFLSFLSFINIFRSSRSQIFFKLGALLQYSELKESPTQVISCEYCKKF